MTEPAFSPKQQEILKFMSRTIQGQLHDLRGDLAQTNRMLMALASMISRDALEITPAEWRAKAQEIEVTEQVNSLFDPLVQRGQALYDRLMQGEEVSEEIDRWLRDVDDERRS